MSIGHEPDTVSRPDERQRGRSTREAASRGSVFFEPLLLGEEAEEPVGEDAKKTTRLLRRHRHPAELLVLERDSPQRRSGAST